MPTFSISLCHLLMVLCALLLQSLSLLLSLSALDAGFLLHPNRSTASHNLDYLVHITFVYSFCYRTVIVPRSTTQIGAFRFCTPPRFSNPAQGRSSLSRVSLYDRSQWFSLFYERYPCRPCICGYKKMVLLPCPTFFARFITPFDLSHPRVICSHTLFTAIATLHNFSVKHSLSQRTALRKPLRASFGPTSKHNTLVTGMSIKGVGLIRGFLFVDTRLVCSALSLPDTSVRTFLRQARICSGGPAEAIRRIG